MAVACYRVPGHAIGSTIVELSRPPRTGAPPPVRISARSHGIDERETPQGPSCIFVGPIETASQATLEALYLQARDSYYGGSPLIPDDMFDRVELKLRWYGSQYVVKYPRCSLRRQATYADAQEDPPQVFALASIWVLILSIGGSVLLAPVIYTMGQACRDAFIAEMPFTSQASSLQFLTILNGILYVVLGSIIGYPIASASARALRGLWQNDLVALRGACPNCGDEVFAFVRSDKSSHSSHRTECHVCDSMLEFCTKVESISIPGQRWVYGRVYLIQKQEKRQR